MPKKLTHLDRIGFRFIDRTGRRATVKTVPHGTIWDSCMKPISANYPPLKTADPVAAYKAKEAAGPTFSKHTDPCKITDSEETGSPSGTSAPKFL